MRTLGILPVKSFGAAKQRLSGLLAGGSREALAQAMFSDVLAQMRRVEGLERLAVVTADPRAAAAARGERVVVIDDDAQAGQSAAARIGVQYALEVGYERVLLVPGDAPLADPAEVSALVLRGRPGPSLTIVPDRHGEGTNALLIAPPDAFEPSFGPGSLERHRRLAQEAGIAFEVEHVPSLGLDVDTPDDLLELCSALEGERRAAPRTRGALSQLDQAKVRGSAAQRPPAAPVPVLGLL